MRKFILPLLAAGFLAVAGTAATPQTANATSVHIGVGGPGYGFYYGTGHRAHRHHRRAHRAHRHAQRWHHRRHCRPIFRTKWVWHPHWGWERVRVKVGRRCY